MVLDDVRGPVGQSNDTIPMPLLIASSRISGKPSKRDESTNTDASAMSVPMSSAGPSSVATRVLEPVLRRSPLEASRRWPRARRRSRQPGFGPRGLGPRRDAAGRSPSGSGSARPRRPSWRPGRPSPRAAGGRCSGIAVEREPAVRAGSCSASRSCSVEHDERVELRVQPPHRLAQILGACSGSSARARSSSGPARRAARSPRLTPGRRADEEARAPAQPAREPDVGPQVEAGARRGRRSASSSTARQPPQDSGDGPCAGPRAPSPSRRAGTRRRTARRGRERS